VLRVGSGLIYAALIVLWAIYFIPRWLHRHDQLSESRSVEKFDHAMRILSRRDPMPDQRYVVMPRRPDEPAPVTRGRTPLPDRSRRPSRPAASVRDGRRATPVAVRRRRRLALLLLVTAVLAASTPLTPVPWWAPVALLGAVLVGVAHVALQERRRAAVARTREAVRRRADSRNRRHDSAERIVAARAVLAQQRAAAEAARVEQEWAAHEAARREAERSAVLVDGWEPTPVPLPTYVTAPRAPRVGRPIDLTNPGKWTELQARAGGEVFDQTREGSGYAPVDPAPAVGPAVAGEAAREAAVDELDAILERRRAVND